MPATSEFQAVFASLRAILHRHAGTLEIAEDSSSRFCLQGGSHPKQKTPMLVASVQIGKAYVSFHHMGVYARPELLKGISKELKRRMQGKSCFNFTAVDETLFKELEDLTVRGIESLRQSGYFDKPVKSK